MRKVINIAETAQLGIVRILQNDDVPCFVELVVRNANACNIKIQAYIKAVGQILRNSM